MIRHTLSYTTPRLSLDKPIKIRGKKAVQEYPLSPINLESVVLPPPDG